LDEIGLAIYEEMLFKVKVYGWTTDGQSDIPRHSTQYTKAVWKIAIFPATVPSIKRQSER
jgi:hypothetical protein